MCGNSVRQRKSSSSSSERGDLRGLWVHFGWRRLAKLVYILLRTYIQGLSRVPLISTSTYDDSSEKKPIFFFFQNSSVINVIVHTTSKSFFALSFSLSSTDFAFVVGATTMDVGRIQIKSNITFLRVPSSF